MAYVALYRQWRPQDFDALVGQKAVKTTLKNALASGKIAHAYLFSGPRGTGKTSMARILAKALNCEQGPTAEPCGQCGNCQRIVQGTSLDVIEIDAASNTSVDNIRDLREQVAFTPAESRYKVYIIDEVHMLSTGAFNALLKTLEEPPAHAVFILATTDPQKVPATIQSRCQRFEFRRVTVDEIAEHLQIWKNQLTAGRTALGQYELILGQYEEAASLLEEMKKEKAEEEQRLEMAEEQVSDRIDAWITEVFHRAETAAEWHPEREVLLQAEQKARQYETVADGVEIQRGFRADYERQRQQLTDEKNEKQYQREMQEEILKEVREQLKKVQEQQELEPERDEAVEASRASLAQSGITAIPFYRTVEFAKELDETACARLEAQLQMSGMLDALVVTREDFAKIKAEHPEFLDAVLQTDGQGNSRFCGLTVSDDLPQELRTPVLEILSSRICRISRKKTEKRTKNPGTAGTDRKHQQNHSRTEC